MFQLANPDTVYKRQITVSMPAADGGTTTGTFIAHLKYLPTEIEDADVQTIKDYVQERLVGWEAVSDYDGKKLTFTTENFERLCKIDYWINAVFEEYRRFSAGLAEKNFGELPGIS